MTILIWKYKTNSDIGYLANVFEEEVKNIAYMWREGGQFSKKNILK